MGWNRRSASRIVNLAAATALAAASALAIGAALVAAGLGRGALEASIAVCGTMFVAAHALLERIAAADRFRLAGFSLAPIAVDTGDLLLTERYPAQLSELLLENVLSPPSPESRVVWLFTDAPAPAQRPPPDASAALRNALTELRRSLR